MLYKINQNKEVKYFGFFAFFLLFWIVYVCVVGGGVYVLEILSSLGERHGRSSLYIQGLEKVHIVVMFWGKLKETFFFSLVNDGYVCVCSVVYDSLQPMD